MDKGKNINSLHSSLFIGLDCLQFSFYLIIQYIFEELLEIDDFQNISKEYVYKLDNSVMTCMNNLNKWLKNK